MPNNKIGSAKKKRESVLPQNMNPASETSEAPVKQNLSSSMALTIQKVALSCFEKYGYNGTTIAQIAKHAKVSPAAIYLHFPSKRALFNSLERPDLDFATPRTKERQQEILQAALDVFSTKCYMGATMDEVAQQVGLSKASLYSYFASKEELFQAMIENAPIFSTIQHLTDDLFEPDIETGLKQIAYIYLIMFHHPNMIKLMKVTLSEGTRNSELASTFVRSAVEHGAKRLANYLAQVGYYHNDDLLANAKLFIGTLFSWVLVKRILAQPETATIPSYQPESIYSADTKMDNLTELQNRLEPTELEIANRVVHMIVRNLT